MTLKAKLHLTSYENLNTVKPCRAAVAFDAVGDSIDNWLSIVPPVKQNKQLIAK